MGPTITKIVAMPLYKYVAVQSHKCVTLPYHKYVAVPSHKSGPVPSHQYVVVPSHKLVAGSPNKLLITDR